MKTKPSTNKTPRQLSDEYDLYPEMPTQITVHEEEHESFTGLYDANGSPLYRTKHPIGFKL